MSEHRRIRRPRIGRRTGIAALAAAALAVVTVPAFAADNIFPDGDIATGGPNASFSGATCGHSIAGQLSVSYNGNSAGGHFSQGESLTVDFSTVPAGVHIALGTIPTVPSEWGTNPKDAFTIPFSTTVDPGSTGGKVEVTVTGNTSGNGAGDGEGGKPNFQVNVDCAGSQPAQNSAPVVSFTSAPSSANEGDTKTFDFAIADADAGDTHSFVSGFPDCGTGNELVSSSISTGTFSCKFPDGLVPAAASAVRVQVSDSAAATSNIASTPVTVNNVNPAVNQPSLGLTSVDCRSAVTLGSLGFTDPGVIDSPWSVDIDWNDGSTHTTFNANSQGALSSQTHTYNAPGTYAPTVTVTDKDGGANQATTSSNSVVVNQVYTTDFLPPFDDSTPSGLIVNQMKNGRVVPVKATIYDVCAQAYVTSPATVTVGVSKTATPTVNPSSDPVEAYSDAGASSGNTNVFRWTADASAPGGGFWIYNLDSKALALVTNSFYRVDAYVNGTRATKTNWGILQPVK